MEIHIRSDLCKNTLPAGMILPAACFAGKRGFFLFFKAMLHERLFVYCCFSLLIWLSPSHPASSHREACSAYLCVWLYTSIHSSRSNNGHRGFFPHLRLDNRPFSPPSGCMCVPDDACMTHFLKYKMKWPGHVGALKLGPGNFMKYRSLLSLFDRPLIWRI